jgi:hypothetical protein
MTLQVLLLDFSGQICLAYMVAGIFSHQKLNPEKEFQNFAYGIVGYPTSFLTWLLSEAS